MYEFCWFIGGIILYRFFSKLLRIGTSVLYIKSVTYMLLKHMASILKDADSILQFKYRTMEEQKFDQNIITTTKSIDALVITTWKALVLKKMMLSLPKQYQSVANFEDWDAAMEALSTYEQNQDSQ